jgi:hypothetical protein
LLLLVNTAPARFRPLVISAVSSLPLVRFSSVPTVLLLAVQFLLGLRLFVQPGFDLIRQCFFVSFLIASMVAPPSNLSLSDLWPQSTPLLLG